MGLGQKEAVFQTIANVLGKTQFDSPVALTKEAKAKVSNALIEGFKNGEINLDKNFDDAGMKKYVSGLLSNWLRKDDRLNGHVKHEIKNKGSRSNPEVKELNKLMKLDGLTSDQLEAIDARIKALQAAAKPVKETKVDFSVIDSDLKSILGL